MKIGNLRRFASNAFQWAKIVRDQPGTHTIPDSSYVFTASSPPFHPIVQCQWLISAIRRAEAVNIARTLMIDEFNIALPKAPDYPQPSESVLEIPNENLS